jgi:hypothetical protein
MAIREGMLMSESLLSADRNTHIRIVAVALVAAIAVVSIGMLARGTAPGTVIARVDGDRVVVKAGQPATLADNARSGVR